jgi:hypothetical protein
MTVISDGGGRKWLISAFYDRRGSDYTPCDRLSALPYRLSDGCIRVVSSSIIESAATEKGGQLEGLGAAGLAGPGGLRDNRDLLGDLPVIGPGDFKLAAD